MKLTALKYKCNSSSHIAGALFLGKLCSSVDPTWTCSCDGCLSASLHLPQNPMILWQLRRWSSQEDGQSRMATTGHQGLFMTHHTPSIDHGKNVHCGPFDPLSDIGSVLSQCHNISSIYKQSSRHILLIH